MSSLDPRSHPNRSGSGGDRFEVVHKSTTSNGSPNGQLPDALPHGDAPGSLFRLGFASESSLLTYLGPAGERMEWHHIVEQWQVDRFGAQAIHNVGNIIRIPKDVHTRLNILYSSKHHSLQGQILRQWLSTKSFEEQYEFGMAQLSEHLGYLLLKD